MDRKQVKLASPERLEERIAPITFRDLNPPPPHSTTPLEGNSIALEGDYNAMALQPPPPMAITEHAAAAMTPLYLQVMQQMQQITLTSGSVSSR